MIRPKLLIATDQFQLDNEKSGGAGVYAYEIAQSLSKRGIAVHVLTVGKENKNVVINKNLIIHWRKVSNIPLLKAYSRIMMFNKYSHKIIEENGINILHSNTLFNAFERNKVLHVHTIHHPIILEYNLKNILRKISILPDILLEKILLKKTHHIIAVSHLTYNYLIKTNPKIKNKVSILSEGVNINQFKKLKYNELSLKSNVKQSVLFSPGGAREERKGSKILLKTLFRLKETYDIKCVISGKSRKFGWENEFTGNIKKYNLQDILILPGEINYKDLPKYYSASDIIVYPSLFEGFGIPILEAMACQKPIIATKTGEASYIIDNMKNGVLINSGDSKSLYNSIDYLIKNTKFRKKISIAGRNKIIKYYNLTSSISGLIKIYFNLLNKKN